MLKTYDVYVGVSPRRSLNGGTCCSWSSIVNGLNTSDPAAFYAPLIESPVAPHPLFFGSNRLYRTDNKGDAWTAVSPVLGGTGVTFPDIQTTNVSRGICVGVCAWPTPAHDAMSDNRTRILATLLMTYLS